MSCCATRRLVIPVEHVIVCWSQAAAHGWPAAGAAAAPSPRHPLFLLGSPSEAGWMAVGVLRVQLVLVWEGMEMPGRVGCSWGSPREGSETGLGGETFNYPHVCCWWCCSWCSSAFCQVSPAADVFSKASWLLSAAPQLAVLLGFSPQPHPPQELLWDGKARSDIPGCKVFLKHWICCLVHALCSLPDQLEPSPFSFCFFFF